MPFQSFIKIFLITPFFPLFFQMAPYRRPFFCMPPSPLPKSHPLSEYYGAEKVIKTDGESKSGMDPEVDAFLSSSSDVFHDLESISHAPEPGCSFISKHVEIVSLKISIWYFHPGYTWKLIICYSAKNTAVYLLKQKRFHVNRPLSNCVRTKEQSNGWEDKSAFFFLYTKEIPN